MKELITHSRQDCFKTCRRKHYYAYELGLRRTDEAKALRMGSAFHAGIEQLGRGLGLDAACESARAYYVACPEFIEPFEWDMERETILRLVCAYDWRWSVHKLEYVHTELQFRLPLINPETGKPTPNFDLGGKIDGIVKLEDGRLAIKETKTMSEDIGPDSVVWRRLRMDHQISLYIDAARRLGFDVQTVLYDVARKPAIEPTPVPLLDGDGIKIVLNRGGNRVRTKDEKKWRQTASTEDGYTLQTRPMTVQEWGEKLTADICERPEWYFARVEVPRMDQDINEYKSELWDIQIAIRDAQRNGRHYRTVNRNTCGYCPYFDICSTNQQIDVQRPPQGFEILSNKHPELEGDFNVISTSTPESAPTATAEAIA